MRKNRNKKTSLSSPICLKAGHEVVKCPPSSLYQERHKLITRHTATLLSTQTQHPRNLQDKPCENQPLFTITFPMSVFPHLQARKSFLSCYFSKNPVFCYDAV